jgi:hypothetical protein
MGRNQREVWNTVMGPSFAIVRNVETDNRSRTWFDSALIAGAGSLMASVLLANLVLVIITDVSALAAVRNCGGFLHTVRRLSREISHQGELPFSVFVAAVTLALT